MSKKQKVLPKVCVACGADYNEAITSAIGSDILALLDSKVRTCTMDEAINSASGDDPVVGIIIAAHAHIDGEVLDRICIPGRGTLKVVSNYGVGVDHIDLESCRERGIPVCHTPNVLSDATADMGFLLLMAASRRLIEGDTFTRKESGKTYTQYQNTIILGQQVAGSTVGIIGMGRIGLEVARRSIGFKMNVLYFNRRRRTDSEEELAAAGAKSVRYCSTVEELLKEADHVVLVCPQTPETTKLINADTLSLMKPSATLVNIARGPVVDTDALVAALKDGVIAAAGLDVTDPEPLPADHPLLSMHNVVLPPHRGSATAQTRLAMAELTVKNLMAGIEGTTLPAPCNL